MNQGENSCVCPILVRNTTNIRLFTGTMRKDFYSCVCSSCVKNNDICPAAMTPDKQYHDAAYDKKITGEKCTCAPDTHNPIKGLGIVRKTASRLIADVLATPCSSAISGSLCRNKSGIFSRKTGIGEDMRHGTKSQIFRKTRC